MKELKITELMREYTDDEFNIEGENAADTEKVLENVIGQVKPKKKAKPLFKVLAAAAAAAVLAGAVTAGTAITGYFVTATGRQIEWDYEYDDDGSIVSGWRSTTTKELEDVLTLQDGRLYFNIKGESTDITDLIDRTTPYIYTYELPQSEKPAYVIAGGTPEEFAVVDLVYTESTGWNAMGIINGSMHGGMIQIAIDDPFLPHDETLPWCGWYMSKYFYVDYEVFDEDQNVVLWHNYGPTNMYPTWREDSDAWLIEAIVQLELLELPTMEKFVLPDIAIEGDTVTLWGDDITEKISEETAYAHRHLWNDAGYETVAVVGGTPGNFGWAFLERRLTEKRDFEYWTIACDNITDADGQLREWYLNAVEERGYDLEELQQNHYIDNN